jgi:single-strand DNA-binding protein
LAVGRWSKWCVKKIFQNRKDVMGVNKVILVGRLGKDPELRYTTQQTPVCSFSLATSERRKDANGNWNEVTEWHNIVVFQKAAENCANFLKKGREVFIEGKIQTRKWQDKEGRDRYTTEIVANNVQFLGGKDAGASSGSSASYDEPNFESAGPSAGGATKASYPKAAVANGGEISFDDDDIPF